MGSLLIAIMGVLVEALALLALMGVVKTWNFEDIIVARVWIEVVSIECSIEKDHPKLNISNSNY